MPSRDGGGGNGAIAMGVAPENGLGGGQRVGPPSLLERDEQPHRWYMPRRPMLFLLLKLAPQRPQRRTEKSIKQKGRQNA